MTHAMTLPFQPPCYNARQSSMSVSRRRSKSNLTRRARGASTIWSKLHVDGDSPTLKSSTKISAVPRAAPSSGPASIAWLPPCASDIVAEIGDVSRFQRLRELRHDKIAVPFCTARDGAPEGIPLRSKRGRQ
jgi:hypothetical protein